MQLAIYQVDAFTDKLFGGNPAAVCPLESWPEDQVMQQIGAENNLAETAFFVREGESFKLRWFTPAVEVDLCGHATLASAHVLFNHLGYLGTTIAFQSRSGELRTTKNGDLITLDFPAAKRTATKSSDTLAQALGKKPVEVYNSSSLLAVFDKQEDIQSLSPDFALLKTVDPHAVIVTAPGKDCDFVSRFFAPNYGINEDPVTGSAHTVLIPYWSARLEKKTLHARQLSKRQGELFCEDKGERVLISGRAVTYLVGEIHV